MVAHSNRNFAVAYMFLVALPVLGLVGVLRSGHALTAPLLVGGSWKIQADADGSGWASCAGSVAGSNGAFTISQSGPNFTVSFGAVPATSASGSIHGTTITASVLSPATGAEAGGCGNRRFTLIASLDPKASPESLSGTISDNDCPACMPIPFHAIREEQAKAKERH